ncbi:MAG: hypothetical protein ACI883_001186 [Candidatus Azotimanducaceae bacterium]|jgi:hypothetical protein|tara:strand:+ start:120 stop:224 length:105 start_codon:yes stop_codon:yes gene_type:complete
MALVLRLIAEKYGKWGYAAFVGKVLFGAARSING